MNVGARIRQLRTQAGLSTTELASLTGISQPVISRLETNSRSHDVETLELICKALNISLADFFGAERACAPMTDDIRLILDNLMKLTPQQRAAVSAVIRAMLDN